MISVLFTKNNYIGSRLIRWVTGEPVSHVAIHIPEHQVVLHSSASEGVDLITEDSFFSQNTIVYKLNLNKNINLASFTPYEGKFYGYLSIMFLGLCYLFRVKPNVNSWALKNTYICTQVCAKLLLGIDDATLSPGKLYHMLKKDL